MLQKDGPAQDRIKKNPRGFLSMDNAKRDEFSNITRTAQWREGLTKEIRFTQKGAAAFYKNLPEPTKEDARMKMLMRRSMSSASVIGAPPPFQRASRAAPPAKRAEHVEWPRRFETHGPAPCRLALQPASECDTDGGLKLTACACDLPPQARTPSARTAR